MAISTTVRNILSISIFACIYNASCVLRGDMHPRFSRSRVVPFLEYECKCASTALGAQDSHKIRVDNCRCAERFTDLVVFTASCSLAIKTVDRVLKTTANLTLNSTVDSRRLIKRKRAGQMMSQSYEKDTSKVRYKRLLLPRSSVREQPSVDDGETAKVALTSIEPSNKWEGTAPLGNIDTSGHMVHGSIQAHTTEVYSGRVGQTFAKPSNHHRMEETTLLGNRDTSGHIVGNIQAQTTEGSSAKREETSLRSVEHSNGRSADAASWSDAEAGEQQSSRSREISGDPSGRMVDKTGSVLETQETGEPLDTIDETAQELANSAGRSSDAEHARNDFRSNDDWIECLNKGRCNCNCSLILNDGGFKCDCKHWAVWQCTEKNLWIYPDPRLKVEQGI